jgi:glucosamine--fructose-6-phosphate aminotransferase (isomerizing)
MTTMLEEVLQQPAVLADVRKFYSSLGAIPAKALRKLVSKWPPVVVFTGMGSSLFAAYPAQAYLTSLGIRALVWETAELLHHHLKVLRPDALVVAVSQSGETVEIRRLLDRLPPKVSVAATVNRPSSTLGKRGDLLLPMMAGHQSTISTKTYMCSVAVLMYLAFAIAGENPRSLTQALVQAIQAQERILEQHEALVLPATVEFFGQPPYVALMSRGADLASVFQGALTLKEVARLAAEATSAAQFRHGPIEIVNPTHRYIIFAHDQRTSGGRRGSTGQFLLKLAEDIRLHGGRVLLITDLPRETATNLRLLRVEALRLGLGTLVDVLYIQLLAHELALRAGLEPGKFWIAEEVTREE